MRHIAGVLIYWGLLGTGAIFGQATAVVGAGYSSPGGIRVAPGQITTFFVSGLVIDPAQGLSATSLPLPRSLAGVSVIINQLTPKQSFAVPLLSVQQFNICSVPASAPMQLDCQMTAITVQIPYELAAPVASTGPVSEAGLIIQGKTGPSQSFTIFLIGDNLHVLNSCDSFPLKSNLSGSPSVCGSIVTHADGTLITADSPGKAGEEIVLYAYGLGQTAPAVITGSATPAPAPVLAYNSLTPHDVIIQFDFHPNAGTTPPYYDAAHIDGRPRVLFNGLTPGQVGLYQVNIKLPDVFPAVPGCLLTQTPQQLNRVLSNLTINIQPGISLDSAAICVEPPQIPPGSQVLR